MNPHGSNRGVRWQDSAVSGRPDGSADPAPNPPGVHFDYYAATIHGHSPGAVLGPLWEAFPDASHSCGRGRHGYTDCYTLSVAGERVCDVLSGGTIGVHVVSSGSASAEIATLLRTVYPDHRVTRADGAIDRVEAGGFDRVSGDLLRFAEAAGLTINQMGDWTRGQARTLYVGSRKSPVFLRVYEKGWKESGDPDWYRIEVEVKPKGDARRDVARMSPFELFGTSRWLSDAAPLLGLSDLAHVPVGTLWKLSNEDRARAFLMRQFGQVLSRWRDELETEAAFLAELDRYEAARELVSGGDVRLYLHDFSRALERVKGPGSGGRPDEEEGYRRRGRAAPAAAGPAVPSRGACPSSGGGPDDPSFVEPSTL